MKPALIALALTLAGACSASAASVYRTYSYFPIRGKTLPEIQKQLETQGPDVGVEGERHPGATRMRFVTKLTYGQAHGRCRIVKARVDVKARVILPSWRDRRHSDRGVRIIWDTLSKDIKRHEDSHLSIAKNHARDLENALTALPASRQCATLAARVTTTTQRIMASHDADQARFDRIESVNFESRLLHLLEYRLEQIDAGRLHD